MTENTALWDKLGKTDPKHTKPFKRAGGFSGTAIKPMWSYFRMTEEFGPCGTGWGVGEPVFQVVPADGEMLVYCTASIWYGKEKSTVYGVGGDKAVGKFSSGIRSDDEAFKKAFTDAVTNALKMIGVGADVHMGMFDDNKYVNTMKEEFPANDPAHGDRRNAHVRDYQDGEKKREAGFRADGTRTAHSLRKEKVWDDFMVELRECSTIPMITKLALAWSAKVEADKWPEEWKELLRTEMAKHRDAIKNAAPDDDTFPGDRPSTKGNAYADNFRAG